MCEDVYGRSPIMDALPYLREFNDMPAADRAKLCRSFVERQLLVERLVALLDRTIDELP
jgi:hypothetical protein